MKVATKNLFRYFCLITFCSITSNVIGQIGPFVPDLSGIPGPSCPNGSVENGNFGNWKGHFGDYNDASNSVANGIIPGRHTIMNGGTDLVGGFPRVIDGNYSIRLGDNQNGAQSDWMSYTFTVDASNRIFQFKYALVLEDPDHDVNIQPDFTYYAVVGNTIVGPGSNPNLFNSSYTRITADASNPFFETNGGGLVYRDWTCREIDLTDYWGQEVTVVFRVRDCGAGGHWGYAYIDGLCENFEATPSFTAPSVACNMGSGTQILVDGSASSDELSHFWEVAESNAGWQQTNPNNKHGEWFIAHEAGVFDIYNWFISKGGEWKCNTYYRITLGVTSECTGFETETKLIYFQCPEYEAGPDQFFCCSQAGAITSVGLPPLNENLTFSWSSTPPVTTPNQSTFDYTVTNQSTTFIVEVTDNQGCIMHDTVNIIVMGQPEVEIEKFGECCTPELSAFVSDGCGQLDGAYITGIKEDYYTYSWTPFFPSNNSPNTITPTESYTQYTVTVNNGCGQASASIYSDLVNIPTGGFGLDTIIYNNTVYPNSSIPANQVMTIYHFTPDELPCYYNANKYRLRIWDRWGQIAYEKTELECCFEDGAIQWDGTDNNGNPIKEDVYNWTLELWNCSNEDKENGYLVEYFVNGRFECSKWGWCWKLGIPPVYRCCKEYEWVETIDKNNNGVFHVTVIY